MINANKKSLRRKVLDVSTVLLRLAIFSSDDCAHDMKL